MTPEKLLEKLGRQAEDNSAIAVRIASGPYMAAPIIGSPHGDGVIPKLISDLPIPQWPTAQQQMPTSIILPASNFGMKGLGET